MFVLTREPLRCRELETSDEDLNAAKKSENPAMPQSAIHIAFH